MLKPFRPPLLKKPIQIQTSEETSSDGPPAKRMRLYGPTDSVGATSEPRLVFKTPGVSSLPRKPLYSVANPPAALGDSSQQEDALESYYNVLWYGLLLYLSPFGG